MPPLLEHIYKHPRSLAAMTSNLQGTAMGLPGPPAPTDSNHPNCRQQKPENHLSLLCAQLFDICQSTPMSNQTLVYPTPCLFICPFALHTKLNQSIKPLLSQFSPFLRGANAPFLCQTSTSAKHTQIWKVGCEMIRVQEFNLCRSVCIHLTLGMCQFMHFT